MNVALACLMIFFNMYRMTWLLFFRLDVYTEGTRWSATIANKGNSRRNCGPLQEWYSITYFLKLVLIVCAVLFTVENTDPKCYWITNYIEVRTMHCLYTSNAVYMASCECS
jgi:hypothetical protein